MLIMAAMLAIAAPGAPDVQALEETHVLAPLIDHTRDGRSYVEFAPTVETRAATCTR